MKEIKRYLTLFFTMFKIGAFTFGGGVAMIALLEHEFVDKRKWIGKKEFITMTAIAESTPGPIAINTATYLGYKQAGILGSLLATIGVVIPSFVTIFVISLFLDAFLTFKFVAYAFKGVRVAVVYLILSAAFKMLKQESLKKPLTAVLFFSTVILMVFFSLCAVSFSSIVFILLSAAIGISVYLLSQLFSKKRGEKE